MMTEHAYTPLLLVVWESLHNMITHLICPFDLSLGLNLQGPLSPIIEEGRKKNSSLLDSVCCVVISYDLWMSKTTQKIFQ